MWVAEFKVWHKGSVAMELSRKYNATLSSFTLNSFEKNRESYINRVGVVQGPDAAKLIMVLGKEPRIDVTKVIGNQVFYSLKINLAFHSVFFDSNLIFIKPVRIMRGFEYWTVASWDKRNLTKLFSRIKAQKGYATIEMISLKQERLKNFFPTAFAQLTEKQKQAIEAVYRAGYYNYPRSISLEELALQLKIPRTTLQEHLRKAESKIIPAIMEQFL
ncbi:helix-turn-helix domain-containing protein [Candidatus Micrarchaeota archaeon]|nr:helix-turn-helix domain-containing protein [Candidatus Micrarchaeota archaeon]